MDYKLLESMNRQVKLTCSALKKTSKVTRSKNASVNAFGSHVILRITTDLPLPFRLPFSH